MIGQAIPHGSLAKTRPPQQLQRPISVIVVCASGPGMLESKLEIAFRIGQQFASHVQVIFFREVESPTVSSQMIPYDDSAWQTSVRSKWDTETVRMDDAKGRFDLCLASIGAERTAVVGEMTASLLEVMGKAVDLFPSYARACDLNVAGGPATGASPSTLDDEISGMALLSSGRLTLLAPRPEHLESDVLRSVLIAWDDSAAVSRTIAQAMPLIVAAKKVSLFIGETSPERVTPCNAILSYLRSRGVEPTVTRAVPLFRTIRETLVRQAEETEASLIVMGAYKHSRMREMLLGGTTRYLIANAPCAVLMSG